MLSENQAVQNRYLRNPAVMKAAARMALHLAWLGQVPGEEAKYWGPIRKRIIELVISSTRKLSPSQL